MSRESVNVVIEDFSGPLDVLCRLVESREKQADKIKMTQIVRIYGAYLSKTQKASAETLAEFFFMVATLLLQKTIFLLPSAADPGEADGMDELYADEENEERLNEGIRRYQPYLNAADLLEERKNRQDRYYRREVPEEQGGELHYDIGDLFFLSRIWWGLLERRMNRSEREREFDYASDEEEEWTGMPSALPEESQIQARIAELEEKLTLHSELSLNALWAFTPTVQTLVVTVLAVLEMCRMGKTAIEQETPFSDVKIRAKK